MKSIVFRVAILVLPLFCAGLLVAAQNGEQPKAAPAKDEAAQKELFELTCGGCHGTDLVTGPRTKEEWTGTVQSMVDKGAYLKKEDTPVLIDYLVAKFGPAKQETPAAK
jgi:mono/diheme cytochrome c family protein